MVVLVGDFKAKQEYINAKKALAVLLAADREEPVTVTHINEAHGILWAHVSDELRGSLVMR